MEVDYYVILQINPDASGEEVHRAYRALALRFHPDRNGSPEASRMMVRINEAYSVLGDPVRRRKYDKEQRLSCTSNVALPILAAARQAVLSHRWTVLHDEGSNVLLEQGSRRVRVSFVERLSNELLRKFGRQYTGFAVILAVDVEKPINLSLQIVVIDLMHSAHYGGGFPDPTYRTLFAPFLGSAPSG
jgi:curved DNA-binding protein CbpA